MAARPWLTLALVVLLILLVLISCIRAEEHRICAIPCCSAEPSCSKALQVSCDCPGMNTIALKKADMPVSVQVIRIRNTEEVIVNNAAIQHLPSLEIFSLSNISNVAIELGGISLQKRSKLRQIHIEDIEALRIKRHSFSGFIGNQTRIEMLKISALNIESEAFHYVSKPLGPSLMLQNIGMLALASNAFRSPVARMSLKSVIMESCLEGSFAGQIQATDFDNVTIGKAEKGCINGSDSWATLFMRSSRINVTHPQAFSGQLHQLLIKDSDLLTIHERSFHLQVRNMTLSGLFVQHLSSNGLSVRADESIQLENVQVDSLRKRALAGLQIAPTTTGFYPPVVIRQLKVLETEPGSLTFSECADVQMTDVDLVAPSSPICPTERWTRLLSEGTTSGPLSPAQHELFWQLYERSVCTEDDELPFPDVASPPDCGRLHGNDAASNDDGKDAMVRGKNAYLSPVNNPKQMIRRVVGAGVSTNGRGSNVPSESDTAMVSLEIKVPGDYEDNQVISSNEAPFEYLVDYKEVLKDVQNREIRKVDNIAGPDKVGTSEVLPAASSLSPSGVKPPLNVVNKTRIAAEWGPEDITLIHSSASAADPPSPAPSSGSTHSNQHSSAPAPSNGSNHSDQQPPAPAPSSGSTHSDQQPPAPALSSAHSDQQHRLLLYLALGSVLSLAVVLAAALLVLLIRRRSRRSAEEPAQPVETLLMVLANRLLRQDSRGGQDTGPTGDAGEMRRNRTVSDSSGFCSSRQSVDSHQYEPIREDLLLPLPAPPQADQLIWLDDERSPASHIYHNLMDR